jgi:hypothetical protein
MQIFAEKRGYAKTADRCVFDVKRFFRKLRLESLTVLKKSVTGIKPRLAPPMPGHSLHHSRDFK